MTISRAMFTSKNQEWETPQSLFDGLNAEFQFTIDLAANSANHKVARYYDWSQNSLDYNWAGERAFLNPPYKNVGPWIEKCAITHMKNMQIIARYHPVRPPLIVAVLYTRTDTQWFHNWVYGKAEIRFIRGRLQFELGGEAVGTAPFPSMICVWK